MRKKVFTILLLITLLLSTADIFVFAEDSSIDEFTVTVETEDQADYEIELLNGEDYILDGHSFVYGFKLLCEYEQNFTISINNLGSVENLKLFSVKDGIYKELKYSSEGKDVILHTGGPAVFCFYTITAEKNTKEELNGKRKAETSPNEGFPDTIKSTDTHESETEKESSDSEEINEETENPEEAISDEPSGNPGDEADKKEAAFEEKTAKKDNDGTEKGEGQTPDEDTDNAGIDKAEDLKAAGKTDNAGIEKNAGQTPDEDTDIKALENTPVRLLSNTRSSQPEIVYEGIDFESDIVYKTHFGRPAVTVENETNYQITQGWHRIYTQFSEVVTLPKNSNAKVTVDYGVIGTLNNRDVKLKLIIEDIVCANKSASTSFDYTADTTVIYFGDNPAAGYYVQNIYLHKATYSLTYDDGTSLVNPIITYGSLNNQGTVGREGNKPINATKISMTAETSMKKESLIDCLTTIPDVSLSAEERQDWYYGYDPVLANVDDYVYNPLTGKKDAYNPKVAISAFYPDSSDMEVYVTSTNGMIWENSFFIAKAPAHDLTIKKETNVKNDATEFNFKFKIWKEHETEVIQTIDYPAPEGDAYAVFDTSTGILTFFRDEAGKYTNGQVDGTKTYYAGFEQTAIEWNTNYSTHTIRNKYAPWYQILTTQVNKIIFEDKIIPTQTDFWFYNMSNLSSVENIQNLKMHNVKAARAMFQNCTSLTQLDTSGFYMPECYVCGSMFRGCENLESLDLSGFNFNMFYMAVQNETTGFANMFTDCKKLSAELTIPCMPVNAGGVFQGAATAPDAEIKIKAYALTPGNVNTLLSGAGSDSNVVFDGYVNALPNNLANYLTPDEIIHGTDIHIYDLTGDSRFEYNLATQEYTCKVPASGELIIEKIPKGYFYTIEEFDIPEGYELKSQTNTSGAIADEDIVAEFKNEITYKNILVNKVWDDLENKLNKRPDNLEITLGTNKKTYSSSNPAKDDNTWAYEFTIPANEHVADISEGAMPDIYEQAGMFTKFEEKGYDEAYTLTNKLKRYSVEIKKEVTGNKGEINREFNFTVEFLYDSQPYELPVPLPQGVTGSNGVYTFSLKDGEKETFESIPTGTQYTITEDDYSSDLYTTTIDGSEQRSVSAAFSQDIKHTFVNDKDLYNLTVTKHVKGNMANNNKEFEFTVDFWTQTADSHQSFPYDPAALPAGAEKISDGHYIIMLSDGDSIKFENLPFGIKYEITETDYSSEGYKTEADGNSGRTITGEMTEDKNHTFENKLSAAIPTDVTFKDFNSGILLIAIGSLCLAAVFMRKRLFKK